jgi:hypothetical protein
VSLFFLLSLPKAARFVKLVGEKLLAFEALIFGTLGVGFLL